VRVKGDAARTTAVMSTIDGLRALSDRKCCNVHGGEYLEQIEGMSLGAWAGGLVRLGDLESGMDVHQRPRRRYDVCIDQPLWGLQIDRLAASVAVWLARERRFDQVPAKE